VTTRVVHRNKEPFDVLCDRTTPWGNPFSHKDGTLAKWKAKDRRDSIDSFAFWALFSQDDEAIWIREHVHELRDKTLGCWCAPLACHCSILARMADGESLAIQGEFGF
jgi:hypothetical protein